MNEQTIIPANQDDEKNLNTKKKSRKLKKILKIIFFSLLILIIIALSAIPPLILNDMVNKHVNFKKTYDAEQYGISSNKLKLTTSDGLNIVAYEVTTDSAKAIVIFLSGIQNPSVTAFFGHSAMLKDNGYASILCEMRAHGESDGDVICAGYKEYLDVKAVVEYIKSNEKYNKVPIVIYGLSMGGAVAINAAGEIPEIDGLISMSAFSSWEDVFADNMLNMGAPEFICSIERPFVKLYIGFKYGFKNINICPKNEIKKLGDRPALIFHSKEDSQIPYQSFERINKNTQGTVETWTKDGDYHFPTEALENPQEDIEYSKRIMDFLDKHFGNMQP